MTCTRNITRYYDDFGHGCRWMVTDPGDYTYTHREDRFVARLPSAAATSSIVQATNERLHCWHIVSLQYLKGGTNNMNMEGIIFGVPVFCLK